MCLYVMCFVCCVVRVVCVARLLLLLFSQFGYYSDFFLCCVIPTLQDSHFFPSCGFFSLSLLLMAPLCMSTAVVMAVMRYQWQ